VPGLLHLTKDLQFHHIVANDRISFVWEREVRQFLCVAHADLEFTILLPLAAKYWDYRYASPHMAQDLSLF
jgi:hypothetical protein